MTEINHNEVSAIRRRLFWLLAATALGLYITTGTFYPMPGDSTAHLASHLRLLPFPAMTFPLWGWVIRCFSICPFPPAVLPSLFSMCCGALSVSLLFLVLSRVEYHLDTLTAKWPLLSVMSAALAALYLMVCPAFWHISNRAHPLSLSILLALLTIHLLHRYHEEGRLRWLLAAATIGSIGAQEFITLLLFSPVLAVYALILVHRKNAWSRKMVSGVAICLCAGPLLLLLAALDYYRLPAAGWREMTGLYHAFYYALVDRARESLAGIPEVGWLMIGIVTLLPGISALLMAWNRKRILELNAGHVILVLAIIGTTSAVLLNAPISPWRITGCQPLLVTPEVASAAAFGIALGYLGLWLATLRPSEKEFRDDLGIRWAPPPFPTIATVAVLALWPAAARTLPSVCSRDAKAACQLATRVLQALGHDRLLVSAGTLDDLLAILAYEHRQPLQIINAPLTQLGTYRRYVASLMPDPRLAAMAEVNADAALEEWAMSHPADAGRLAVEASPNLWLRVGATPVPRLLFYDAATPATMPDANRLLAENQAFWNLAVPLLNRWKNGEWMLRQMAPRLKHSLSAMANNLGISMQNAGHANLASPCYFQARKFNPLNLCAYANLWALFMDEEKRGPAERVVRAMENLRSPLAVAAPAIPQLVETCGHIRTARAVEKLLLILTPAPTTSKPYDDSGWVEAMLLYTKGQLNEARQSLERFLAQQPDNESGWSLMAQVGLDTGNQELIHRGLAAMNKTGKTWPAVLACAAQDALNRRDFLQAGEYYDRLALNLPYHPTVREVLLLLDVPRRDYAAVRRHVQALLHVCPGTAVAEYGMGALLAEQGEAQLAEEAYQRALAGQMYAPALAGLAQLKLRAGDWTNASQLARQALALAPDNSVAWTCLAATALHQQKLGDAARNLSEALRLQPDNLEARLLLLQLFIKQDNPQQAQGLAQELYPIRKRLTPAEYKQVMEIL